MQFDRRMTIKERWGNKPCRHPSIEKEYVHGSQTGDFICTQCGREVDPDDQEVEPKDE
jgi:hypothetical protein